MAVAHLTTSPLVETPTTVHRDTLLRDSVVRAIVHLNFSKPDQALSVLLDALTDFNFAKEVIYGNAAA